MARAELPRDYAGKMRVGTAGLCTNLPVLHNSVFPMCKCGFRDTNIVVNCFFLFPLEDFTDVNCYINRILSIPLSKALALGH